MKIRKTIALLTVFAMIIAMVPAMALTAFAADPTAILLDDGTAYKVSGTNLIEDGSFESDSWEKQLTTGNVPGKDGKSDVIDMNSYKRGSVAIAPFARKSGARTGSYALSVVQDSQGKMTLTNANSVASIKHYIENTAATEQAYYLSFYAKGLTDDAQLTWSADGVDDSSAPSDASVKDVTLTSEWTKLEKVVKVKSGDYLLINVYNMAKDKVLLDDFAVYAVYTDSETEAFEKAMKSWNFESTHYNGELISADIELPTTVGSATVTWVSSNPEIISADGEYSAPASDTEVTLTATIALGEFSTAKTYKFKTQSFFNDIFKVVENSVVRTVGADLKLMDTVPGYEGSVVKWSSANKSIIADDGTYTAPTAKTEVTLTATVTYKGLTQSTTVTVLTGVVPSLITNAGFDLVEDDVIVGWTVGNGVDAREGGTAPMTTANFDLVTEDGNNYILSKGHEALTGNSSVRTYIDLEPGKAYTLTYDIRYMGDGTCDELYIAAGLVTDSGAEIDFFPGASYNGLSKDDGWQTIDAGILLPTEGKSTLLIGGKWLNRGGVSSGEGGHYDGRWAMDNFILQEIDPESKTDVTVKYVGDDGKDLGSRVIPGAYAGTTQVATADDKADKTLDGSTYRYDSTSVDSVKVSLESENVITLKFKKLVPANVTVKFMDRNGNEIKEAEICEGNVGFVYNATTEQKASVKSAEGGVYILEKGANESVMVQAEGTELVLYFTYSLNLVENGDFSNGVTGWTNRKGTAITGATVETDPTIGQYLNIPSTGGKTSTSNIGTSWKVEIGKRYNLSFDISVKSLDPNYNRISDVVGWADNDESQGITDCAGNIILAYGAAITTGQWNHLTADFVAQTDTVYMQASWADEYKLANVMLTEIDESKVGSVTINFLDRETNTALKTAKSVGNVVAGTNYKVDDEDKANITFGDAIYSYDTTSVDNVDIKENVNGTINLYFTKVEVSSVEGVTLNVAVGDEVTLPATVKVNYNNGTSENVAVTWNSIPALEAGETYTVAGEAAGNEAVAEINVFYAAEKPDDYDNYKWIKSDGKEYPVAKDAENLIANGSFEDGTKTGWNSYNNGVVELGEFWSVTDANAKDGLYSLMAKGDYGWTGSNSTNNLQTYFTVENGKRYLLKFSEYWNKAQEESNSGHMTAAVISDGYGTGNHTEAYGGWSSWKHNPRTFARVANQWIDYGYVFDLTSATLANPYVTVAYSMNACNEGLYLDAFELYELASDEVYASATLLSKLTVSVDGVETVSYVEKGSELPNYRVLYPNATVVNTSGVDTNKPNAGTVVILTKPELGNSVAIIDGNAVVYAIDSAIDGVAIVAQYKYDGINKVLVSVATAEVKAAKGAEATVPVSVAADAEAIKVMVVDSLETMNPLTTDVSTSVEGKFAPAAITPCDEPQANQGYVAKAMFDGNKVDTRWTSQMGTNGGSIDQVGGEPNSWVVLDFGKNISATALDVYPNRYDARGTIYDVLTSEDGINYTTVVEGQNTGVGNQFATTDLSGSYRYIKIVFHGNDSSDTKWTSVNEIVVR